MKVIDLCCGAGGFSEGFRQAGFKPILGVDIWATALESYQANHHCDVLQADIRDLTACDLPDADVIIGSPPCQCFSLANKSKNKTVDLSIIETFLKIIHELRPSYWVMEEVPQILKYFPKLKPQAYIIPAYRYGVQQIRKRVYVGNFSLSPAPPISAYGKYPAVKATEYAGKSNRNFGRLADYLDRKATIDECRQVMGFPDSYIFRGNKKDQYIQIGNAVCPPVARAIAEGIIDHEYEVNLNEI